MFLFQPSVTSLLYLWLYGSRDLMLPGFEEVHDLETSPSKRERKLHERHLGKTVQTKTEHYNLCLSRAYLMIPATWVCLYVPGGGAPVPSAIFPVSCAPLPDPKTSGWRAWLEEQVSEDKDDMLGIRTVLRLVTYCFSDISTYYWYCFFVFFK